MKHNKVKYFLIVTPVVLVIAAVILGITWASSSSEGTISAPPASKGPTTYYDQTLNGTYISFKYSGKYIARDEVAKDNNLELHRLSADTHYDKQILASVANLPDGRLESNGDYNYRAKSPTVYTDRKVQVGGVSVDVWVKNDGTEQTAMMAHGTKIAVVSFTTANQGDDLTNEVDTLLKTLRWKQ